MCDKRRRICDNEVFVGWVLRGHRVESICQGESGVVAHLILIGLWTRIARVAPSKDSVVRLEFNVLQLNLYYRSIFVKKVQLKGAT
jgi:hypothetical protein